MKRSNIKRRPLADTVLEKLEPEEQEYRELDGNGLYFRVKPNGRKSWSFRYKRPNKKWAWKGVGSYPQVSGKAAREKADELQKLAADGVDLSEHGKEKQAPALLFKDVAETWYDRRFGEGLSAKTTRAIRDALDGDVIPEIGDTPLTEVTRKQCMDLVAKIEQRNAWEVAKKVRGWLSNIFSLAVAMELCELNPASELRHVAQKRPETIHHPHLLESELPAFLKALDRSGARYTTRVAVQMVLLTASRPGVVRAAEWHEIDLDNRIWSVPAEKMKKKRGHLFPISDQLAASLESLKELTGMDRYLFPGAKTNPYLSHTAINAAISGVGYKGKLVGHGARHTASTLLNEHGWRDAFVDMQLSHKLKGVRGVYNKAQYLSQRATMMQWYADYLDALQAGITAEQKEQFASRVIG